MTFTIKIRGAGGLICSEYRCPVHGVFAVNVQREANGDPPSQQSCPASMFEDSATDCCEDCAGVCGAESPFTMSAPRPLVDSKPAFATIRGGDMKDRPPGMLDTRPLAEGMKMTEWKKLQREETRRRRHAQLIDKGIIAKKVIV